MTYLGYVIMQELPLYLNEVIKVQHKTIGK
jgi:hypothetical protein